MLNFFFGNFCNEKRVDITYFFVYCMVLSLCDSVGKGQVYLQKYVNSESIYLASYDQKD